MHRRHSRKEILAGISMLVGLSFSLQASLTAFAAPNPTAAQVAQARAAVATGKAETAKGHLDSAISVLSKAAKVLGTSPGSCECHLCLGKVLCLRGKKNKNQADLLAAKKELRTAIRVGRGNMIAKQANEFMMANLPKEMLAPRTGEGTEMIAVALGLRRSDRGVGGETAKPQVLEFYADWCAPCKELREKVMPHIKQQYGDKIEIISVNVDDPNNAQKLEQYDVSPIPTMIFLNADSQVVGYSIGYSGDKAEQAVQKELQKLLPPVAATAPKS